MGQKDLTQAVSCCLYFKASAKLRQTRTQEHTMQMFHVLFFTPLLRFRKY